jgi:hypothetical protein
VLLNSPLLLLPLQRDRLVRMALNARAQSCPATIRETRSRPIQYKPPLRHAWAAPGGPGTETGQTDSRGRRRYVIADRKRIGFYPDAALISLFCFRCRSAISHTFYCDGARHREPLAPKCSISSSAASGAADAERRGEPSFRSSGRALAPEPETPADQRRQRDREPIERFPKI